MKNRYARQIMLSEIGETGQQKLSQAKVLVVGVGGLGSPISLYLAAAGVGCLGLVDADVVSESNLQRQILYKECDVGKSKVACATKRLKEISSSLIVHEYNTRITVDNAADIISRYDIVADGSDNAATRYIIDHECALQNKPFVHGAIAEYTGQVSVFDARCNWRYSDLYPRLNHTERQPATTGVIGTLPGIIGTIQATEVIKLITGMGDSLIGQLFCIDIRNMETTLLKLK